MQDRRTTGDPGREHLDVRRWFSDLDLIERQRVLQVLQADLRHLRGSDTAAAATKQGVESPEADRREDQNRQADLDGRP